MSRNFLQCSTLGGVILLPSLLLLTTLAAQTANWPVQKMHVPTSSLQRLPPAERATIMKLLRPELGPLFQGEAPSVADQAIRDFRAEPLNLGGVSAVAVMSEGNQLCSGTGNCSFWIVDPVHRRVLLRIGGVQGFAVDHSKPHSTPDVYTGTHVSSTESEVIRWRFQADHFEPESCATVDSADESGAELKEPKINPHPCSAEGN